MLLEGEGTIPTSWLHELITLVPKDVHWTGSLKRLRPLLSPSTTHKIFSRLLLDRILHHVSIPAPQWAKVGMSTSSILHHITLAAQRCYDRGIPLYVLRIDLASAYDTVLPCRLLRVLLQRGCPPYLVRAVRDLVCGRHVRFRAGPICTPEMEVHRGVAQGHTLSPFLFGLYVAHAMEPLL
eukprot:2946609-Amphidinium_carterae.1